MKIIFLVLKLLVVFQVSLFSVEFIKIADFPEIYECEHFLTAAECETLIAKAKPLLSRSTVVDSDSSKNIRDKRRTSLGAFLDRSSEGAVVRKIRKRTSTLTELSSKNGEDLQVLYYPVGGEYQPHFDYFDPNSLGGSYHLQRGGQRIATLLVYLNTPTQGGETVFPVINKKVKATQGKAILFYNVNLQGKTDPNSLHGGAPVLVGEKWVATLWIREHSFH